MSTNTKLQIINSNRNEIKENLNHLNIENRSDISILLQIDSWQMKLIEKVNQTADQLRKQFLNLIKSKQDKLKNQFQILSQQIDHLQTNQTDLDENLLELEKQINEFNRNFKQSSQLSTVKLIINRTDEIKWNDLIYLEEKSLNSTNEQSLLLKEYEFAIPGTYPDLYCEGRQCSKCGKCRDWYFTGDLSTWEWIRNNKNWTDADIQRWRSGYVFEHFKCRDGETCSFDHGFGLPGLPPGPHLDHRLFSLHICLCEDNIKTDL